MKVKTSAEFAEMSHEDRDKYKVEYTAFLEKSRKDATEIQIKEAVTLATKALNADLEALNEKLKELKDGNMPAGKAKSKLLQDIKDTIKGKEYSRDYSAKYVLKAAVPMTTASLTSTVVGGFTPLAGYFVDEEIGQIPLPQVVVTGAVRTRIEEGTQTVYFVSRDNQQGDAQFVAEGGLKPLVSAEWLEDNVTSKEIAERWKFSKKLNFHANKALLDFSEYANKLVEEKVEWGVIYGDSIADAKQFNGLSAYGTKFLAQPSLAGFYYKANIYDVINATASCIRGRNYTGQLTAVLPLSYKALMMGIKTDIGSYIVPPFVNQDGTNCGGVNVLFSNVLAEDDIILGDLGKYNLVINEDIIADEGLSGDDFDKNMISKKLEMFLCGYVKKADLGAIIFDKISLITTLIKKV